MEYEQIRFGVNLLLAQSARHPEPWDSELSAAFCKGALTSLPRVWIALLEAIQNDVA